MKFNGPQPLRKWSILREIEFPDLLNPIAFNWQFANTNTMSIKMMEITADYVVFFATKKNVVFWTWGVLTKKIWSVEVRVTKKYQ